MYDQSRRFVDDQHMFIFVRHGQFDGLGLSVRLILSDGHKPHRFAAKHRIAGSTLLTVDGHTTVANPALQLRSRKLREHARKNLV